MITRDSSYDMSVGHQSSGLQLQIGLNVRYYDEEAAEFNWGNCTLIMLGLTDRRPRYWVTGAGP